MTDNQVPTPEEITLRDWFAGMAMQGLIANSSQLVKWGFLPETCRGDANTVMAERSYVLADAMLEARKK